MRRISVIDTHTAGEPTRVVIEGGPDLGEGSLAEKREVFRLRFDKYRAAIVNDPRGSDVVVAALLTESPEPACAAGVIFFNNVGYLGMCGHGTMGVVRALAHLGRITAGDYRFDTPVGVVSTTLEQDESVSLCNVPSYRRAKDVKFNVCGMGDVIGDVAWGGNWFFLTAEHGQELELCNVEKLTEVAWRIRQAVNSGGFPEVDHIELFGAPKNHHADSRNFVLCPGRAYDRSPCGTGTSAKLACLAADGKLNEGERWLQESIVGSTFTGTYRCDSEGIVPTITGRAFVTGEATLLLDDRDPFCWGIE